MATFPVEKAAEQTPNCRLQVRDSRSMPQEADRPENRLWKPVENSNSLRGMIMRKFALFTAVVVLGCGDGTSAPRPPKTIEILNYLNLPVTLTVDGVAFGSVNGWTGLGSGPLPIDITVPSEGKNLTYSIGHRLYSDGTPVANDIAGETITLPPSDATLGITNIVQGVPYFTFNMANTSGVGITVCLARDGGVVAIGSLGAAVSPIGSWWGYYALTSTTEVRIYRAGGCSGSFRFWSSAVLATYAANAGTILLTASIAP